MRTRVLSTVLTFLIAAGALAHGGHKHGFLGTVKSVDDKQLVISANDNKVVTFTLTGKTKYTRGAKPAARGDLKPGIRVSVAVENDGKTATAVKIGTAGK